jgi:hypothetical protein
MREKHILTRELALFYHIWTPPESLTGSGFWRLLIDEQIKRIQRSNIHNAADIFCCISGENYREVADYIRSARWINTIETTSDNSQYEGLTLKHLLWFSQTRPQYKCFGYIHTKGMSPSAHGNSQRFRAINSWRHMMEAVVIDRWREACAKTDAYDLVGAIYGVKPWPHMVGNFWWARAGYVRSLIDPISGSFPDNFWFDANPELKRRTDFERWVGLNYPKAYSFVDYPFTLAGGTKSSESSFNFYTNDVGDHYFDNLRQGPW